MSKAETLIEDMQGALPTLSPKLRQICQHALDEPVGFIRSSSRQLCDALGTSEPTLIRFCQTFGHSGLAQFRIDLALAIALGGASVEPSREDRRNLNTAEKQAIARAVLPALDGAQSLILDNGSTVEALAEALQALAPRTVMTTGIDVAQILLRQGVHDVLLPGGRLRAETASVSGRIAERTLAEMHFDLCILGADSIDPAFGISTFSEGEAELNRRMVEASARLIVLADGDKFGHPSLHRIARPDQIHLLVTNLPEDHPALAALRAGGMTVLTTAQDAPDDETACQT